MMVFDRGLDLDNPAPALRREQHNRRLRTTIFDRDLFGDQAWDILIDLYAAHLEKRTVSISSATMASTVPPTTALRMIGTLIQRGLVERAPDGRDNRRSFVFLTPAGIEGMQTYLTRMRRLPVDTSPASALPDHGAYVLARIRELIEGLPS